MQFVGASPIEGSNKSTVWLANEVDNGYYVLRELEDSKEVYIPRPNVAAIYFDASQDYPSPK